MSEPKCVLKVTGAEAQMELSGLINSRMLFPEASALAACSTLNVQMKNVKAMNSEGVRLWIQWHATLPPKLKIRYHEAPAFFVPLASIVHGLVSDPNRFESFHVNYFLQDRDSTRILLIRKSPEGRFRIPAVYQGHELDHFPHKDFKVLKDLAVFDSAARF
jgi:hypothetical protein